ncbi:MAG: peptide chain release factor 1 [Oscillospiraceae bacterium]|nr:peptide chain release factor 1 [Oscillospiraceae bacterium]
MIDKLKLAEKRYIEIEGQLSDPEITDEQKKYRDCMREYKGLTPLIEKYREYAKAGEAFNEAKELLAESGLDSEFREMAQLQLDENRGIIETCEEELKLLLLPRDPDDDRNVIIEIRGGAGGDEAALFVNSLYRMYSMFATLKSWKIEVNNSSPTELGGYKEIAFSVVGEGAYAKLKYESGVHRVQRVPETEAQGRIHTSTVTVAVLPEVEEVDVEINPADLEIQTFRASGAGGQHINKTESAIRIIHKPSGVVVECQEERSQHKNKDKALKMLYSKLYEAKITEQNDKIAQERKIQVGSGDRSERIRTYNFPQGRVTDHRIGLTLYKLEQVMNGDCDEVFDALAVADKAAKLTANSDGES